MTKKINPALALSIWLAALGAVTPFAHAMTPDKDPVLAAIVSAYSHATPPKLADLKPSKIWKCKAFQITGTGYWGSNGVAAFRKALRFTDINLMTAVDNFDERTFPSFKMDEITFGADGVVSAFAPYYKNTVYARITPPGSLILEATIDREPVAANGEVAVVENQKQTVATYLVCPATQVEDDSTSIQP